MEIKSLGRRVVSLELDVQDEESNGRMAEAAFGQIHIWPTKKDATPRNLRKGILTWEMK